MDIATRRRPSFPSFLRCAARVLVNSDESDDADDADTLRMFVMEAQFSSRTLWHGVNAGTLSKTGSPLQTPHTRPVKSKSTSALEPQKAH
jgi:hypothetical protein